MKYRLYIDEVGNPDLGSSENPLHRFLSITGVIIDLGLVQKVIFPQLEALKSKYFGSHPDEPVILHRKEIVNARYPFQSLANDDIRSNFDKDLLEYLFVWNYTVLTVCLDKKNYRETYGVWRYDPYHYCMSLLLENYTFYLEKIGARGDVMAESRGGKEDRRLKASFAQLWREGTEHLSPERFHVVLTSKELKVKPKQNNIAGLQIADVIAHPSRNEILQNNGLLNQKIAPFAAKIIRILQTKYFSDKERIYGKKFI